MNAFELEKEPDMKYADSVWKAEQVLTLDTDVPATHIAVKGETVLAVGDGETVAPYIGPATEVFTFDGATIVPGLSDSHLHPVWGLEIARGVGLGEVASLEEVKARLAAEAQRDVAWILGWGLDPNVFDGQVISGTVFDQVTAGKPLYLRMRDAHAAVINSEALRLASITGQEVFPDESQVMVGADGRPTGYLKEMGAIALADRVVPDDALPVRARRLQDLLAAMAQSGLTSGQVMDFAFESEAVLRLIEETDELPIRLRFSPMIDPGTSEDDLAGYVDLQGRRGRRWIVEGVKFMVDGTVDNGTAWLEEPDSCGESTQAVWSDPAAYARALLYFVNQGIPTASHAVGDRAVRFVLDTLASVPAEVRRLATHRIEHVESIPSKTVQRFAELGVAASMQPIHATRHVHPDGSDKWSQRLGAVRAARAVRARDLRDAGVTVALGSDWPVVDFDPRGVMADSILRRPYMQPLTPPIGPEQSLDARMVLEGYTTHSAQARGHADTEGRIRPGYRADFTVFAQNPLEIPAEALATVQVLGTVVGGIPAAAPVETS